MTVFTDIQKAVELGDPARVNELLEKVLIEEDPDSQYTLAEWFSEIGYLEEAVKLLEHLQFLFPEETGLTVERAVLLIEIDREDEAQELLTAIPETDDHYPQALVALADLFQSQGLLEAADRRLDEAMRLLPGEPLLIQAKAEILLESGRYLEAARLYGELLESGAEIPGVSLPERLAEVYSAGAAYEEALPHYEQALEEQSHPDTLFGAAFASFQAGRYTQSLRYLDELIGMDPDYFSAYLLKAQNHNMTEEYKEAYTAVSEGIRRDEYDKELFLFAGKLALKLGEEGPAENHLREAIALDPDYMEAIQVLMMLLHRQSRSEDVLELAEMASTNGSDWAGLYPVIAAAYEEAERYGEAMEYYERAYEPFKEDPGFLSDFARFLLEEGQIERAIKTVDELLMIDPDNAEWLEWRQSQL
ncbi:tetratricopeptide repeat protein [Indiicoccus explosivorum]|uniref:tetratricopeptide repeat protein n=1 Tax=Indiicoccus explosivorum TaxID=1917864 RepID=UPI000B4489A1|nr:tetratricopeptide repeat protein [Indiicoccus explosivorum]